MPTVLLIAAAGIVGLAVLFGGASSSSSSGKPRVYTLADVPKLRQLLLEKTYLGRELRLCLQRQTEHSLFTVEQTIAFGIGLFTGVATLNPATALKAARGAQAVLEQAGSKDVPCRKELELTAQQLRNHDATCRELGLPTDVTYEQVMAIVNGISGGTLPGGHVDINYDPKLDADAWDRCVRANGVKRCVDIWKQPGHPKVSYDPKTGLAIR